MIQVLQGSLGPGDDPVHLIVESIEEEAKKFLRVLLTEKGVRWVPPTRPSALFPILPTQRCPARPLLIAHESRSVSLDLGLELRGVHHIIGGRCPYGLDQFRKLCGLGCICPLRYFLRGVYTQKQSSTPTKRNPREEARSGAFVGKPNKEMELLEPDHWVPSTLGCDPQTHYHPYQK